MSRFGYGDFVMAADYGGSGTVASVRSLGSGGSVIRLRSPLGDEATQVHSQGSPMGKDGSQVTQEATQVRHTQPPFVRSFARSLARSLAVGTLTAHHWGGRGRGRATLHHRSPACSPIQFHGSPLGKEGRHWGTTRHKCTTIGTHYWGGVTGGARGDTEGYTSAPYSTTIRSFVR